MLPHGSHAAAVILASAAGVVVSTQAPVLSPKRGIEISQQQGREGSARRLFRTGVTRVEVSALPRGDILSVTVPQAATAPAPARLSDVSGTSQ